MVGIAFTVIQSVFFIIIFLILVRIYLNLPRAKSHMNGRRKLLWWKETKEFDQSDYDAFVWQLANALK